MNNFKIAFETWGKTQMEFTRITGLDRASVSRFLLGKRAIKCQQLEAIYNGFQKEGDVSQGVAFVAAAISDYMPPAARSKIEIRAKLGVASKKGKLHPREAARQELLNALEREEPWAVDLAVVMAEFKAEVAAIEQGR